MPPTDERTKMKYITSISIAIALGVPILGCATQTGNTDSGSQSMTREEVRADLDDWAGAGLANIGEAPDVYSPEYQRRLADYERRRASRAQAATRDPYTIK